MTTGVFRRVFEMYIFGLKDITECIFAVCMQSKRNIWVNKMTHTTDMNREVNVRESGRGNILMRGMLALILLVCVFLLVISRNWSETQVVKSFEIEGNSIISKSEIFALVKDEVLKIKKEKIVLRSIEAKLAKHPFISSSIASFSKNDKIKLKILEKKIIACIIESTGRKNMVDSEGNILPYRNFIGMNTLPRLINFIRCGKTDIKALINAVTLSGLIESSFPDMSQRIAEIGYCDSDGSFYLKLKNIKPVIKIGRMNNLDKKIGIMKDLVIANEGKDLRNACFVDLQWVNRVIISS